MSPTQILLHEVIVRALQMIVNAWKKYLEEEKAKLPHKQEQNPESRM